MNIAWGTTLQNPWRKPHTHGADDGQIGWRLHAIPVDDKCVPVEGRWTKALCGMTPHHGWGLDAFIDRECDRCVAAMKKREASGEVFVNLPEVNGKARDKAFNEGNNAAYAGQPESSNPYTGDLATYWLNGWKEFH